MPVPSPTPGPSQLSLPRERTISIDTTVLSLRFAVLDENSDSDSDIQVPQVSTAHTLITKEDILAAQLEHGLDLLDREPENPAKPHQPHYQNLVALAVQAGLNVPPRPPVALPAVVIHQPPVAPMAQQAPAPAPADSRLIGVPPPIFDGDRTKSKQFIHDFTMYRALNFNHCIMQSPYLHTLLALQYIKGPLVQDWTNDYVTEMNSCIHC